MSDANKALIHRWFEEVWNKGRSDAIDEMFAEDGIAHGLSDDSDQPMLGLPASRSFIQSFAKPAGYRGDGRRYGLRRGTVLPRAAQ
jgi:hypothetical protein